MKKLFCALLCLVMLAFAAMPALATDDFPEEELTEETEALETIYWEFTPVEGELYTYIGDSELVVDGMPVHYVTTVGPMEVVNDSLQISWEADFDEDVVPLYSTAVMPETQMGRSAFLGLPLILAIIGIVILLGVLLLALVLIVVLVILLIRKKSKKTEE